MRLGKVKLYPHHQKKGEPGLEPDFLLIHRQGGPGSVLLCEEEASTESKSTDTFLTKHWNDVFVVFPKVSVCSRF